MDFQPRFGYARRPPKLESLPPPCTRNAGARRRNRVRAEQQFQGQAFLLACDLGERCEGFGVG
jgi:hypothetical protein